MPVDLRDGVFAEKGAAYIPVERPTEIGVSVELVRCIDAKVRFYLDARAQRLLEPSVGQRIDCESQWSDGFISTAVDVIAVHPGGFVDCIGFQQLDRSTPEQVWLRRYAK